MKLRAFGVVFQNHSIVILSCKMGKGRNRPYTVKLILLRRNREVITTLPDRKSAKEEVIRWLSLYTSLTATERYRIGLK